LRQNPNKRLDHLDQRGGPYNRVELVKYQYFEGVKGVTKETVGTCQPEVSFSLMVAFFLNDPPKSENGQVYEESMPL
jgi:hypothetical protein